MGKGGIENLNEFKAMLKNLGQDCRQIQAETTKRMANACLSAAKRNTPVGQYKDGRQGGTLRQGWQSRSEGHNARKGKARAEVYNNTEYGIYVNDGHRIVNRKGQTVGWVMGKFMLESGVRAAEKMRDKSFAQLMEEAKNKNGL